MNTPNVSGHLRDVQGIYHTVLNWIDINGKRHTTSKTTGLPVKGNKKKAEAILYESIVGFVIPQIEKIPVAGLEGMNAPVEQFIHNWIEMRHKLGQIRPNTYASYLNSHKSIERYFSGRNVLLSNINSDDIDDFYMAMLEKGQSGNTIHKHHAVIHGALGYAVKKKHISHNPDDQTEKPKKDKFRASFLTESEMDTVIELFEGTSLEWIVKIALFYGLRRSEIIGLRWDSFDFESGMMTIFSTVNYVSVDGAKKVVAELKTKNDPSVRSFPLEDEFIAFFKKKKEERDYYRSICGKSYNKEYVDYVFVNELGNVYNPNNVTSVFLNTMKNSGIEKHVRFHDLRHSCASYLLRLGFSLKEVQEWLGHSDISTTGNTYAHILVEAKKDMARTLKEKMRL